MRTSGQNQRRQTENSGIKNRRRKGGDLQGRRLSLAPIRRRPVVASQPAARLGWRGLRHRSQLREPAEESPAAAANACPPEREALLECPPRPPAWARPCCLRRRRTAHSPCCSAAGGGGGGGGGFALADSPAPPLWCGPDACLWACVGRSPGRIDDEKPVFSNFKFSGGPGSATAQPSAAHPPPANARAP